MVRASDLSLNNHPFKYRLNQIEVLRKGKDVLLCPGMLVFFKDTDDDLVAIGIVVGIHSTDHSVHVTPICENLNTIGVVSLAKFINDGSTFTDSGISDDMHDDLPEPMDTT